MLARASFSWSFLAYPFWSIAMIGIAVAVIFSVRPMAKADEEIELPM